MNEVGSTDIIKDDVVVNTDVDLDAELAQAEAAIRDAVQVFNLESAPKKLQGAAQLVKEFYSEKYKDEGTIEIRVADGLVQYIKHIDTDLLLDTQQEITESILEEVTETLQAEADEADEQVKNAQVGTFGPAGAEQN